MSQRKTASSASPSGRRAGVWVGAILLIVAVTGVIAWFTNGRGRRAALVRPAAATGPGEATPSLAVRVTDVRGPRGTVNVGVWRAADGFPDDPAKAVRVGLAAATTPVLHFDGLPAGSYAVAAYHDENGNGRLDRGDFDRPTEGYGTSHDVRHPTRSPTFEECRFDFAGGAGTVDVRVQY